MGRMKQESSDVKLDESLGSSSNEEETEWGRWLKVFTEVEERECMLTSLQFQMEEALDEEDYAEAARVKAAIDGFSAGDVLAEVLRELKLALEEERYSDAAHLRDEAGAGLCGWWTGMAEGENDIFGRIVHISPVQGRLVARAYSAKQLATAGEGLPIFEVFVDKDGERSYRSQPVFLQRGGLLPPSGESGVASGILDATAEGESDEGPSGGVVVKEGDSDQNPQGGDTTVDPEEAVNRVLSFLKDRIPGVKVSIQVPNPSAAAELPKLMDELLKKIAEIDDASKGAASGSSGSSSDATSSAGVDAAGDSSAPSTSEDGAEPGTSWSDSLDDREKVGAGSGRGDNSFMGAPPDGDDLGRRLPIRVMVGGMLLSDGVKGRDNVPSRPPQRRPATIERRGRDEFVLHRGEDDTGATAAAATVGGGGASVARRAAWKAVLGGGAAPQVDAVRPSFGLDPAGGPAKMSKELGEIVRLAVSQAIRGRGLPTSTRFRRIDVGVANTDPFSGIYIGAFGPYMSEIVQLRRKFGRWEGDDLSPSGVGQAAEGEGARSAADGGQPQGAYEYVEAVKLTGDLHVPATQVTFRAKIGRDQRLSHRGIYPAELGVTARYKGQGRLAEAGFKNPRWIDGELVLLDGKGPIGQISGGSSSSGAELGFVFSTQERHFLVLFNRLKLGEWNGLGTTKS